MPTYDYRCDACDHTFEAFQSMTAAPMKKCPSCGRLKLRRLIGTGAGVIFKGSGFYETDYRSDAYKQAAKAETESAKAPASESKESSTSTTAAPAKASDSSTTKASKPAKSGGRKTKAA